MTPATDAELVERTAEGDRQAFGELVERHQAVVSGVAYSVVGDFSQSEDVAQEAFVSAWRQLDELREPFKFKAWVCGIARNVALTFVRREVKTCPLDPAMSLPSKQPSPVDQMARHEEETLVWRALAGLPETYREPLVMFYREEQSVARVSEALDLSLDATKQRLARGREMLREELTATIERALRRSAPGKAFTVAVVGMIFSANVASAGVTSIAAASKMSGPLVAKGITAAGLSAWMGVLSGFFGAGIGIWAADRSTRFSRERNAFRRGLVEFAVIVVLFALPLFALSAGWWNPVAMLGGTRYALALIAWQLSLFAATGIWVWRLTVRLKRIVAEETDKGTPEIPGRSLPKWEGRRWTSSRKLFGLPLVDIQFADPGDINHYELLRMNPRFAFGWIAMGDRACGLVAFGQVAMGPIALGSLSFGGLAGGAIGVGLVSFSGLSIGLVSLGGLALGGVALGGLAVGWLAIGGGAFAWRAAKGGLAIAHDFALGGQAIAHAANNDAAKDYFDNSVLFSAVDRVVPLLAGTSQSWQYPLLLTACVLAISGVATRFAYRRKTERSS